MSSEQDQANPPPYKRREVIGDVTIYLGDCRQILPVLEPVDHIISDPPYEEEAHTKGRRLLGKQKNGNRTVEYGALDFAPITDELRTIFCHEAKRLSTGWVLAFCQAEAIADWRDAMVEAECKWKRAMIWLKPDGAPQFTGDRPGMGYESIAAGWAGDKRSKWNGGGKHGVFSHAQRDNNHPKQHMTQKPLKLMRELVSLFTNPGNLVLDPFLGSGTTGIACAKLGRRFIGIEIEESFFNIACQRFHEAHAQGDMFVPLPKPQRQETFFMTHPQQLGFGFDEMLEEQRTAYLPSTMEEAIPFYRKLIERHHEAMLTGDVQAAMRLREEAHDLAIKLNDGTNLGICAPDGPAKILEAQAAAPIGTVPLWGQKGDYIIDVDGMRARIEQDGLFGIGASMSPAPGFAAHAVDYDKPFISDTGYRSFIGYRPDIEPGMTPDVMARETIRAHLKREAKGKLCRIGTSYVQREIERRAEKSAHESEQTP